MRPSMTALIVAALLAAIAYFVWNHYFSRSGKIEIAYNTCMKQIGATADKGRPDPGDKGPKGNESASALTKGLGDALVSIVQGVGGAVCGTIKDSCMQDFNGKVCQAALNRFK
jgi:hypothetical protein